MTVTAYISFLTEQTSMLEDCANFNHSHTEYAEMQIETIKMEVSKDVIYFFFNKLNYHVFIL